MTCRSSVKKKCMLAPNNNKEMTATANGIQMWSSSGKEMTDHAIMMRRREHSSLHLNGIQTEMRRCAVSKINVHEDIYVDKQSEK